MFNELLERCVKVESELFEFKEGPPIIGRVTTIPLTSTDGEVTIPSTTHNVIKIIKSQGHTYYVTDKEHDPAKRPGEPLIIVDILVKSYIDV